MVTKESDFNTNMDSLFKSNPLFAGISDQNLALLESQKKCSTFTKGSFLFKIGTQPSGLFYILSGKIKIYAIGSDGKQQIIQLAKKGQNLGFRTMLSGEKFRVSAEVLEDAQICFIPKIHFLAAMNQIPKLNQNVLKKLSGEINEMAKNLTQLAQKPVKERLAATLIILEDFFKEEDEDETISINLTREDLANFIGTATETVIRLLITLKKEGYIAIEGRIITIISKKELQILAKTY
ncbi:MAG: Crp/Fnr family transcriptional regulator [Cellulophaga sp.]